MKCLCQRVNLRHLRKFTFLSFLFLLLASWPGALSAQISRGTLRGTVQDSGGGRISSAQIVVQTPDSALQREATSDERGEFRIDDIAPGTYQVVVTARGFARASSN